MNNKLVIATFVALILGVSAGFWLGQLSPAGSSGGTAIAELTKGERQPLFYRNPMNLGN